MKKQLVPQSDTPPIHLLKLNSISTRMMRSKSSRNVGSKETEKRTVVTKKQRRSFTCGEAKLRGTELIHSSPQKREGTVTGRGPSTYHSTHRGTTTVKSRSFIHSYPSPLFALYSTIQKASLPSPSLPQ